MREIIIFLSFNFEHCPFGTLSINNNIMRNAYKQAMCVNNLATDHKEFYDIKFNKYCFSYYKLIP